MLSKVTTAPTSEPVTLDEVKASLKITNNAEDALLTQYIQDARIYAENYTGRKFITQTVTAYYDNLRLHNDEWWDGVRVGSSDVIFGGGNLELEFGPVQSIPTFHTIDTDNAETLYASSNYYLNNYDNDLRAIIELNDNASILGNLRRSNSIKIVYISGYGVASTVPSALKRGVIQLIGKMYSNRGDCTDASASECGAKMALDQYRFLDA